MNDENLISFTQRSDEERKAINAKGGRNKGINAKKRKAMAEMMSILLGIKVKDQNARKRMKEMGVKPEDINMQTQILLSMMAKASKGDVRAFEAIRDTLGETPKKLIIEDERESEEDNVNELLSVLGGRIVEGIDDNEV